MQPNERRELWRGFWGLFGVTPNFAAMYSVHFVSVYDTEESNI